MAKITVPQLGPQQGRAQIGINSIPGRSLATATISAGSALRSANVTSGILATQNAKEISTNRSLQIAQQELETKRELESLADSTNQQLLAEQDEFENRTIDAFRVGLTQKSMTRASERFRQEAGQRLSQEFDAFDNPTYADMPKDVKEIGEQILQDTLKEIDDPVAAQDFRLAFKEQLSQDIEDTAFDSRQKQLSWDKGQVIESVNQIIENGAKDSFNRVDVHAQKAVQALFAGFASGVLSEDELNEGSKSVVETLKSANLENVIDEDIAQASQLIGLDLKSTARELGIDPEQLGFFVGATKDEQAAGKLEGEDLDALGITEEAQSYLKEKVVAKAQDDYRQFQKAEHAQQQEVKRQQNELYQNLQARRKAGVLNQTDIVESKDKLTETQLINIQGDFLKAERDISKENNINADISTRILSGRSTNRFSNKEINEHYYDTIDAASQEEGRNLSLTEKATFASSYNRPVEAFAQELNVAILSGNTSQVEDGITAYIRLKDSSSALVSSKFTDEALILATNIKSRVSGGQTIENAIEGAKKEITLLKDKNTSGLVRAFNNSKDFKVVKSAFNDSFRDKVADSLDADVLSQDVVNLVRKTGLQLHLEGANYEDAYEGAIDKVSRSHGNTTVNGDEEFMAYPPGFFFPGVSDEKVREVFDAFTSETLPEGQYKLKSGDYTVGRTTKFDGKTVVVPQYAVVQEMKRPDGSIGFDIVKNADDSIMFWPQNLEGLHLTKEEKRQEASDEQSEVNERKKQRAQTLMSDSLLSRL